MVSLFGNDVPNPKDLRIGTLFLGMMNSDYREAVVARALAGRDDVPASIRQSLNSEIDAVTNIPGFRNSEFAPPQRIIPQVLRQLHFSESLTTVVLQTWAESQISLRTIVVQHLDANGIGTKYPNLAEHRFRDYWSGDKWARERDTIAKAYPEFDVDDISLMLCYVTGMIPRTPAPDSEEEMEAVDSSILSQAIQYLADLPAVASEWSKEVPDFQESLARIADEKRIEREAVAEREELSIAISMFRDDLSEQLDDLELNVSSWFATNLDASHISDARILLDQLHSMINEFALASNQNARTRMRIEREVLPRIDSVKSSLDQILTSTEGPDDGSSLTAQSPDEDISDSPTEQPHCSSDAALAISQAPDRLDNGSLSVAKSSAEENTEPALSTDAALMHIQLSDGVLEFKPDVYQYNIPLSNSTTSLFVETELADAGAMVSATIVGPHDNSSHSVGVDCGNLEVTNLPIGNTVVTIIVTAEDGATTCDYTLILTRMASGDATLSNIGISSGEIDFAPSMTDYQISVPSSIDNLTFTPKTTHPQATIRVAARDHSNSSVEVGYQSTTEEYTLSSLPVEDMVVSVIVTAEDGETTQMYTVALKRAEAQEVDYDDLLWSLVSRDDLAGAYWVAKSIEAQGLTPVVPPLLLKTIQGARWLSPYSDRYAGDLAEIVSQTEPPIDNAPKALLGLAASLRVSIIKPGAMMLGWLSTPDICPVIEQVVSPIREFASRGLAVNPEDVRGDEAKQRLDSRVTEASISAKHWLEESLQHRHNLARANNVWRNLCTNGGPVIQMLAPVVSDNRQEVNVVKRTIEDLRQESYIEIIDRVDRLLLANANSTPKPSIAGAARSWLLRRIEDAVNLSENWCLEVEKELEAHQGTQDWLLDQVAELRDQVSAASVSAFDALSELSSESNPPGIVAGARCVMRSLQQLLDYLNIQHDSAIVEDSPKLVAALRKINDPDRADEDEELRGLDVSIARRLLWIPSLALDDSGTPSADALVKLAQGASTTFFDDTPIREVIENRLEADDFRFFCDLLSALPQDTLSELKDQYKKGLDEARRTLGDHIQQVYDVVEQAANDMVIEFESEEWDSLRRHVDDIDPDDEINIARCHDTLDVVQKSVASQRELRCTELAEEWEKTLSTFDDMDRNSHTIRILKDRFEAANSATLDIRVMEDCIALARDYRSGESLGPLDIYRSDRRKTLERFVDFQSELESPARRNG